MKERYKRYGPEFKREALKRASEEDVTDVIICEELGINARQLRRWRDECDTAFYGNMKNACKGLGDLDVLDIQGFSKCQLAANYTYEVVRRRGEKHFQSTTSTYCEYR